MIQELRNSSVWTSNNDGEYTVEVLMEVMMFLYRIKIIPTCDQFETADEVRHVGIAVRNSNEIVIIWEDHTTGNGILSECSLSNEDTELSCTKQDDWDTDDVQRMSLLYLKDTFFLIAYRETISDPGIVRTYDSIPEFANIFMPILSVLAIVGLKYRRNKDYSYESKCIYCLFQVRI